MNQSSVTVGSKHRRSDGTIRRRDFLRQAAAASVAIAIPGGALAAVERLNKAVRIGVIADLHQDIMHDGLERMTAFTTEMSKSQPDAVMQLGDFAYPNANNSEVIDLFNQSHDRTLHVIGNHDTDSGHTIQQCLDVWNMPARYYTQNIEGLNIIVLDGNDKESPTHKGGYASFIGPEQTTWLKEQLDALDGPIIIVSHQPLAGYAAVDNAEDIQGILSNASDKVILAINGHTHVDDLVQINGISYLHVNSASYLWVGEPYKHESYGKDIHASHRWIEYTCPYRDPLFTMLTIDPANQGVTVNGIDSAWVGSSPADLGRGISPGLTSGDAIAPKISEREIQKIAKRV